MSRHERWRQVTLFLKKVLDGGDCRINVDIVYFQCLPALGWFCKTVITVDGGEGGTGAAPVELTNSVGMPLRDGLHCIGHMNSFRPQLPGKGQTNQSIVTIIPPAASASS